jgi:hypothetical protein
VSTGDVGEAEYGLGGGVRGGGRPSGTVEREVGTSGKVMQTRTNRAENRSIHRQG